MKYTKMINIMKVFLSSFFLLVLSNNLALSQNLLSFNFLDSGLTEGKNIQLEAFEYRPVNWNGKVILMSHGSTGGKTAVIKNTIKFLNISKEANASGYIFVTYMRKGRGNSEGSFTEESGRCDWANLSKEKKEAELQISQVVEQVKKNYSVPKVILMGHSRGGFLSATYAAKNPTNVSAVLILPVLGVPFANQKMAAWDVKNLKILRRNLKISSGLILSKIPTFVPTGSMMLITFG